jgi:hypothetical protein
VTVISSTAMPRLVELTGVQPGCSVVVVTGADVVEVDGAVAPDDVGGPATRPGDVHPTRTSPMTQASPTIPDGLCSSMTK